VVKFAIPIGFFWRLKSFRRVTKRTVESKREIYKRHPDCRCVLVIQQGRFDVSVNVLTDVGWAERRLTRPDDQLVLEEFGLRCALANLYRGTALVPRKR
jgi:hypothetical protein